MTKQVFNPYLPECEYIPDGEPHVFGDRVYVYGSHDLFDGDRYCPGDYNVWSAPVTDLKSWRNEGVTFRRKGPQNKSGRMCMWAPDVCQGPDGKYYMYFGYNFKNYINVCVCDTPAGEYRYLGKVKHKDGTLYGKAKGDRMCFDPGVLNDNGQVYLYSGFCPNPDLRRMLWWQGIHNAYGDGGQVMMLEDDMLTIKGEPHMLIPGFMASAGTGFKGHEMYEASSIRKVGDKYFFIYSSRLSHELAYAVSDYPDRGFTYGGAIISNGDIGFQGRKTEEALNYWGNNHGSIENINGQWYIFYHRQTNKTEQSRQGCAERIEIKDGRIEQVEMTSCGLNGGPLEGKGLYPSYIACNLFSRDGAVKCAYGPFSKGKYKTHPCVTQESTDGNERQYIQNMQDGATAGYKYFSLSGLKAIKVKVRGQAGTFSVSTAIGAAPAGEAKLPGCSTWTEYKIPCTIPDGQTALYFTYHGEGSTDFLDFELV